MTISNLQPCTILLMVILTILQAYICKITPLTTVVIQLTLTLLDPMHVPITCPNVRYAWNNLPDAIKSSPCISIFKCSLLYHFYQAHVSYHRVGRLDSTDMQHMLIQTNFSKSPKQLTYKLL